LKISELLGKTHRDNPSEVELISHKLMLRSAMIYQVGAGIYAYLPLAWTALRKIEEIIRQEMNSAGSQELRLSILQPKELWDTTGRTKAFGDDLFTLTDRKGRTLVVAPTHEEELTAIVKAHISSYRDLPKILYQIHTKFRDEPRSRGGLMRVREFDMKDAYSLDVSDKGLDSSYQKMVEAYKSIYKRCGLNVIQVEADSGAIGGKDSHEFVLLSDSGEDAIVLCEGCGYAANIEKARFARTDYSKEGESELAEVSTPQVTTINGLTDFLDIPNYKTIKTLCYVSRDELILVVIRGDLDVNEVKLKSAISAPEIRLASPKDIEKHGLSKGYISPVGINGFRVIADESLLLGNDFAAGGNKNEVHLINVNYPRDFKADLILDVAQATEGQYCTNCTNGKLEIRKGIEVGHVFKLGDSFSKSIGATFADESGSLQPVIMGCYGIGLGRLLAAAIEQHNDEDGIKFPVAIAPYQVHLIALNVEKTDISKLAEKVQSELTESGLEVLYDDRIESTGKKFKDADLMGMPIRIVVSLRNLKENVVEIKARDSEETLKVKYESVVETVKLLLDERDFYNLKG
jgi:prolyl-tRNA synthetase